MAVTDLLTTFFDDHGARLMRYAGVSVISVVVGQSLLFVFYQLLGWDAVIANLVAAAVGAIPAYILNRYWVWEKSGQNQFWGEIVPFWAMALLGATLSTITVALVQTWSSYWLAINAASLFAFGIVWIAKYFVLDNVLFAASEKEAAA